MFIIILITYENMIIIILTEYNNEACMNTLFVSY